MDRQNFLPYLVLPRLGLSFKSFPVTAPLEHFLDLRQGKILAGVDGNAARKNPGRDAPFPGFEPGLDFVGKVEKIACQRHGEAQKKDRQRYEQKPPPTPRGLSRRARGL
jgi:hypothetical protein